MTPKDDPSILLVPLISLQGYKPWDKSTPLPAPFFLNMDLPVTSILHFKVLENENNVLDQFYFFSLWELKCYQLMFTPQIVTYQLVHLAMGKKILELGDLFKCHGVCLYMTLEHMLGCCITL